MGTLLSTLLGFILTSIIGARLTLLWQQRSLRENRLFDALRETHSAMAATADEFVSLIGARIYSSQRICLLPPDSPSVKDAVEVYKHDVIAWNKALIRLELQIRRLFKNVYREDLERLQSELRAANLDIEKIVRDPSIDRAFRVNAHRKFNVIRSKFVSFADDMNAEIRVLFREMHFGVRQRLDSGDIHNMSTRDLVKSLFYPGKHSQTVIGSASNFGSPVDTSEARFRIYEE